MSHPSGVSHPSGGCSAVSPSPSSRSSTPARRHREGFPGGCGGRGARETAGRHRSGERHRPQRPAVPSEGTRAPGQPRGSGERGRGAPPRRRPTAFGLTRAGSPLPARCRRGRPRHRRGRCAGPAALPPPSFPDEGPGLPGAGLCACSVTGASARPGAGGGRAAPQSPGSKGGGRRGVGLQSVAVRCRRR